jgi:hypothetical protein
MVTVDIDTEHGGDVGVAQHVRVNAWQLDAGPYRERAQAAGSGVPVHAIAGSAEQDRSFGSVSDCSVDGAGYGGREWR